MCAHCSFLELEVMLGVKGVVVMVEDELGELDKQLSRWKGGAFVKEVFQGREIMVIEDVGVQGSEINGWKREGWEVLYDVEEIFGVLDI